MPNFIDDDVALGAVKSDLTAIGTRDPDKTVMAADWNEHRTALLETKAFLRGEVAGATNRLGAVADGVTITGAGTTASPLVAVGGGSVEVDGVTITGDGSVGDPLVAVGAAPSGSAVLEALRFSPVVQEAIFTVSVLIHDWEPTAWATRTAFDIGAADDEGTRLTGAAALADGTIRVVFNRRTVWDDGIVAIQHQHEGSVAANRFITPNGDTFFIPCGGGAILIYDGTTQRWRVLSAGGRVSQVTTQGLGFFTDALSASLSGTINNWEPTAANLQNNTFASGLGAGGGSLLWKDNTVWRLQVDAGGAELTGMLTYTTTVSGGHGPVKILVNNGPGTLTIKHNSSSSDSTNRIFLPGGVDLVLPQYASAILWMPSGRTWRLMSNGMRQDGTFSRVTSTEERHATITPATMGATENNWNPTGFAATSHVYAQADGTGGTTVTGMAGTTQGIADGAIRHIHNLSSFRSITFKHASTDSNADNRYLLPGAVDLVIGGYGCATFIYRSASSRWLCVGNTAT